MNKLCLLISVLFTFSQLASQKEVSIDFEGDGKMDKATIFATDEGFKVQYSLSSQQNKTFKTALITLGGQSNSLKIQKNVLIIDSQHMRGEQRFKYRYDAKLKQVKLIGYDNVQYGNATNDGSGSSNYNLSTGNYEANWNSFDYQKEELIALPTIKAKIPQKTYLLNAFCDAHIEALEKVGYDLLPKSQK